MRRCWRGSPPTTSRMFLRSSAWRTSAPRLQRAAPGTPQPLKQQRGRASLVPGPRPKAAATAITRSRRMLAAPSHWPGRPLLQLQHRVGAVADREATNAPVSRPIVTTAARSARCTSPCAIPRRRAGRSRSLWNNYVKRCSSSAKMVRLPANGSASRRWTRKRRKTQRWSSRMPRGH
jgi:hypothetical protein